MPYFDQWGWHTQTEIPGRFTALPVPTNMPEGHAANFTGHAWTVIPYSAPPANAPIAGPTRMTKLAFRNRFTKAEKVAIEIAGVDRPTGPPAERNAQAALRVYQQDVIAAQYIDPSREDTRAGVQQLEAVGILAAGRALIILDTPITDEELFVK